MNPLEGPSLHSAMTFDLRHDLQPGDLGALVSLHGTVYAREYGFDAAFEADVAHRLGEFVQEQAEGNRLWIAERKGRLAGCIAIIGHSDKDAQLCWFLVDPAARLLGLGRRLLHEAVAFCLQCRYDFIFLRSLSVLSAASRLFRSVGFEKVDELPSQRWGVAMIEEWYVLYLLERRPFSPCAPARF